MPEHEGHEHEGPPGGPPEEGHEHRAEPSPPPRTGPGMGGVAGRVGLSLAGGALMIVGVFLDWLSFQGFTANGTDFEWKVFFTADIAEEPGFFVSAGFIVLLIGIVAVVGAALPTGWLSRLGGVLGVVAFILYLITIMRVEGVDLSVGDTGIGMWLILAGGVIALVGGFIPGRTTQAA